MRPGRAADHSPPSSAAVMEEYSYTSTHPLGHTGPVTGKLYLLYIKSMSLKNGLKIKLEGVEKTLILCIPVLLELWWLL